MKNFSLKAFSGLVAALALFFAMSFSAEVQAQAGPLTVVNTQGCPIILNAGAGPQCNSIQCTLGGVVGVPAGGVINIPPCGPANYRWLAVKFQVNAPGGGGGVSYNNLFGCPIPVPGFGNCGLALFTGVWVTPNLLVF